MSLLYAIPLAIVLGLGIVGFIIWLASQVPVDEVSEDEDVIDF